MVDKFSRKQLNELIEYQQGPCVSIFAKMEVMSRETKQNPIRFRNLLNEAKKKLKEQGHEDQFLQPLEQLIEDSAFWQHQSYGLAAFAAPGFCKTYRVARSLEDSHCVADRFEVKPLIPVLVDGYFYMLCLSRHDVRLYRVSRFEMEAVDMGDTPTNIEDALWYDDREQNLQWHSKTGSINSPPPGQNITGSRGIRNAFFFGTGQEDDHKANQVKRFFQIIDNGVTEAIAGEDIPLILAAQTPVHALYKEVNHYSKFDDQHALIINPGSLKEGELHQRAWEEMEPVFHEREKAMIARYQELNGTGLTSNDIREVVEEAEKGRVDSLFITDGESLLGQTREENGLTQAQPEEAGEVDLLNLAALKTLETNGFVYVVNKDAMPDRSAVAALYRY